MYILSSKGMKNAEKTADDRGISYFSLMKNAGNAAADFMISKEELSRKRVVILAGNGNNGGDGFVLANRLFAEGAEVTVALFSGLPKTDCAKRAYAEMSEGVRVAEAKELLKQTEADIVIDGIFGTGFRGDLGETEREILSHIKKLKAKVYAVDLPSGVECDSGRVSEGTLAADCTLTFAALKCCHLLPPSNALCGETVVLDIGISEEILKENCDNITSVPPAVFEKRDKNSHKGSFGTTLAVVGSYGMAGATVISGKAAIKSGVGIVKLASAKENYTALAVSCPEAIQIPLSGDDTDGETLLSALDGAKSLLIGCGMGQSERAAENIALLLENTTVPTLLDADGINNIASRISILKKVKAPLVLTPHPGEMARLTGKTVTEIEADRFGIAKSFAEEFGVWLCLKGANTVIAAPDGRLFVNLTGNPGMAKGGSGDMLAGLMAGLLAYNEPEKAILSAVWLHSLAGDKARDRFGERTMTVSDMLAEL